MVFIPTVIFCGTEYINVKARDFLLYKPYTLECKHYDTSFLKIKIMVEPADIELFSTKILMDKNWLSI